MKVLLILLVSIGVTFAQYSYPVPTTRKPAVTGYSYPTPAPTYLPPYEKQEIISPVVVEPVGEWSPDGGNPYDFTYSVKDNEFANDYSRNEQSDGENVKGEYRTLMPDGRMQIVRYTADWKNGYNAEVIYEGQARY